MSLKDDLQEIDGVGEATADKIMDVLEDHGTTEGPWLSRAYEALENGDEAEALTYLKRSQ